MNDNAKIILILFSVILLELVWLVSLEKQADINNIIIDELEIQNKYLKSRNKELSKILNTTYQDFDCESMVDYSQKEI